MFSFRPSDGTIIKSTLAGRPQAFETLVFRYQAKAHAVARALGLGSPEVDDAVQEAFLQAYRDLPSLREPGSFGAWFLNIVRHVSIKELRRASRGGSEAGPGSAPTAPPAAAGGPPAPSAAEEVEQKDFREYLWRKVAALPEGTREAIFLYYYQGESVRAVARALGLSVSGAKRRLRSGREALREKLWRSLEQHLRETLPTPRQWKSSGRRLGLLVLASIPASFTARAGAMTPGGTSDPIEALSRRVAVTLRTVKRPVLLAAAKKAAALAALALLLLFLGREGWVARGPGREPAAVASHAVRERPLAAAPTGPAAEVQSPRPSPAPAEPSRDEEKGAAADEKAVEETSDEANRGTVVVRVIWGDDRTPAAGVSGLVVPWGSPSLYVDERTFTTGPDGTARVDHLFKGGASVWLDRGGAETKVKVEPGKESEAVIEVPPDYRLTIYEPQCPFACAVLEETRPGAEEVEVRIDRGSFASAYLLGRVFDAAGNPCPEAKVICHSNLGGYRTYFTGKEGGAFRLGPLPRGRYRMEVQARSCPSLQIGEQDVEPGQERDLGVHYLKPALR